MTRVVICGAGSLEFSSRLTADILSYPALRDCHFALLDTDSERLDYAGRIVERIIIEGRYEEATFSSHTRREDALVGADVVITSILVGGYEAIESEIDIPKRFGVDQAIGDTLTPGGIMRCLRTLPHQVSIVRDLMRLCPDALLLNYTNPMAMLCWGMYEAEPNAAVIGLCHSVQHTTQGWARRLNVDIGAIEFECAGLNHQAWITSFRQGTNDLMPQIRSLAEEAGIWRTDSSRMEYVKHFGYPVTEASGHNSEYSPWFRKNAQMIERYCPGGSWNGGSGFIKTLYDRPDWRTTMEGMASGDIPVPLDRSDEYGSQIVNARITNKPAWVHGNVRNDGLIDNLPNGCCVEVPCEIDGNGIHPKPVGSLPLHLAAINRTQINVQELAIRASQNEDPEMVFQAMALDPLTSMCCTLDEIRDMTIELLKAHKPWLPEGWQSKNLPAKKKLYSV